MKIKIVTLILGFSLLAGTVCAECMSPLSATIGSPADIAYQNCVEQEYRLQELESRIQAQEERMRDMEMENYYNPGAQKGWYMH